MGLYPGRARPRTINRPLIVGRDGIPMPLKLRATGANWNISNDLCSAARIEEHTGRLRSLCQTGFAGPDLAALWFSSRQSKPANTITCGDIRLFKWHWDGILPAIANRRRSA